MSRNGEGRRRAHPSGCLRGNEEGCEHLLHLRQLITGLKAARVGRSQRRALPRSSGWRPIAAAGLRNAVRYACSPSTATQRGRSIPTLASSCLAPSRSSAALSSLAAAVTRPTRFVMPMPSPGRVCCSAGRRTDSVNPPARSNFQNRFPGRAKCNPRSPESVPGLIPQKSEGANSDPPDRREPAPCTTTYVLPYPREYSFGRW